MSKKNKLIVISGPTATGKTSLSVKLAKEFSGEVLNFDSLVFYKEISIGCAKPTLDEMQDVPHHLVGSESIYTPLNAADFVKKALPIIENCHKKSKPIFVVGGSGFYLQALLKGMYDAPDMDKKVLDKSEELYLSQGIKPFLDILAKEDRPSFERYHENDHYRIRRAVEYFWQTGEKFSQARANMDAQKKETHIERFEWDLWHIHLDIPKEEHFKYIQARSSQMLKEGLIDEVNQILNSGADGSEKPLNSIGYKEAIAYIRGDFETETDFIERLNINTRRLAKAQRTWFKKVEKNCYNPLIDQEKIMEECREFLKS